MQSSLEALVEVISTLLDKEKGCPWDREQNSFSLCKYIMDEMYELVDAVHNKDLENITEEYGDVLFLLFMLLHILSTEKKTLLEESIKNVIIKMKHRHPYVFTNTPVPQTEKEFIQLWEEQKRKEKGREIQKPRFSSIPESTHPFTKALHICKKLPTKLHKSLDTTYIQYQNALENNENVEEKFIEHFYSLLEEATKHTIDIQSLILQKNNSIIVNFTEE